MCGGTRTPWRHVVVAPAAPGALADGNRCSAGRGPRVGTRVSRAVVVEPRARATGSGAARGEATHVEPGRELGHGDRTPSEGPDREAASCAATVTPCSSGLPASPVH